MSSFEMELPPLLLEMLEAGRWPRDKAEADAQNHKCLATPENIQQLAADESLLFLLPPPFDTVRTKSEQNDFWLKPQSDPGGINFDLAIDIGDFGLGSDAPILLDYRESATNPKLLKLHWTPFSRNNRWVHIANSFEEFILILDL